MKYISLFAGIGDSKEDNMKSEPTIKKTLAISDGLTAVFNELKMPEEMREYYRDIFAKRYGRTLGEIEIAKINKEVEAEMATK